MSISLLQPSFAAGEISPSLHARVDLARFQIALKTCKNFVVMPHGGVKNRPGTQFVDETPGGEQVRLIRFKFNNDDSYALVFSNLKMRVVRDGAYVLNSAGPDIGLPFELVTTYALADLEQLSWTQSADVMTFVHQGHKPRELKRFAHDNWTITDVSLVPSIAAPASATATYTGSSATGDTNKWTYQVTAVYDDGDRVEESLPITSNQITIRVATPEAQVVWPAVVGATYYNLYKDRDQSGIYGFIGRAVGLLFDDANIIPTKSDTPPTGLDPFIGAGNYPGAVGYYQQRMVYGGTLNRPQTNWFSRVGVYNNFGFSTPQKDDDAITWTMASTEINQILNYLPLRQLLTLTSGAEWAIDGTASGFTSKTINGSAQSYNGSGHVPPLVLNNTVLYLQSRGKVVSSLGYSLEADGLSGENLTLWASHLVKNYGVVEWAYAKSPDSVIWCKREDGTLLGLTYMREQDVVAWHRHETDGTIESLCTVPESREDVLYMVVIREINGVSKRYIERMVSRQIPVIDGTETLDIAQCNFVDCGLGYQGWNTGVVTYELSDGVNWNYPETLTLTSSSGASFSVADVGRQVHFRDPTTEALLRLDITAYVSGDVVDVVPIGVVPVGLRDTPTTDWALALKTFGGLSHLEGKSVAILADGSVVGGKTVVAGTVTLQSHAAVAQIGLPYVSDLETLAVNISGQETLLDKKKIVTSITLMVEESRGIFAGKDADSLFERKQRIDEHYNEPTRLLTGAAKINIENNWEGQGQVFIRQVDPLPLTILGIIPELTLGGKS